MKRSSPRNILCFSVFLIFFQQATATEIYIEKDEYGNPVFTDNNIGKESTKVTIQLPNTVVSKADPDAGANQYQEIEIRQLSSQPYKFHLKIYPGLKSGHRVVWLLDGQPRKKGVSRYFSLSSVAPGTHTVQVSILDANNQTLISKDRKFTKKVVAKQPLDGDSGQIKPNNKPHCKGLPAKAGEQALWEQYKYQQYAKKDKDPLEEARYQLDKVVNKEVHRKYREAPCTLEAEKYIPAR